MVDRGRWEIGRQELFNVSGAEVGHADAPGQALVDQALEGGPGLPDGGLAGADLGLGVVVVPARRVAHRRVDVLGGDGEVDQVEVEVVEAPILKLLLRQLLDLRDRQIPYRTRSTPERTWSCAWNVFHNLDVITDGQHQR